MSKSRVEKEEGQMELDNFTIDTTPQPRVIQPNPQYEPEYTPKAPVLQEEPQELVNCLRNERVEVKFIPKDSGLVTDPNHVLSGGMSENATRSYVVPKLASTGMYKNVLTNDEMAYLEYVMGLEKGTLSVYRRRDNFWDDSNPNGIGRVTLHKRGNYLDLSTPSDYIKYKILLANKNYICPSVKELEEKPKATYQYVIVSEAAEMKSNLSKGDATIECYTEYGAIRNDADRLRTIVELMEKRPTAPKVKLDYLQGKVMEYIQTDPRKTLRLLTDPLLPAKVLIKLGTEKGILSWRNNLYSLRQDNSPLCEMGEESTLNNAARFISSPKHSEIKYLIEAKLKEE